MPKVLVDGGVVVDLRPGMDVEINFQGEAESRVRFRFIIERSQIDPGKAKYELLARKSVVLLRLDIRSSPHKNPDGARLEGTHLHRYRQGYDARFAEPIPSEIGDPENLLDCLRSILEYCNVVQMPTVREGRRFFS